MSFNFQVDLKKGFSFNTASKLNAEELYDLIIIGGGPAGLNAALYAKRRGLRVGILTKRKGGQLVDTSMVDNYLGIKAISGENMVEGFLQHLHTLDIPIRDEAEVVAYASEEGKHQLKLSSGELYQAKAILISTGSNPRHLGVRGEDTYAGKGVAYCAICDAPLFKGKDVLIAGGGNSAVESALDLAKVAKSVTLVHRSQLRADRVLTDKLYSDPKIKVCLETQILEIMGDDAMEGILALDKKTGEELKLAAHGIFIEIGHIPNLGPFKDLLTLNNRGEILVDEKNRTSISGIFAAGDVTQIPYKQIIIAASDGAKAALSANEYLNQLEITSGFTQ
ncbi:MAG: FAD-dependent oxidoreductase [Clostridiaceae bacterium]